MSDKRKIFILTSEGEKEIDFMELKDGDEFSMEESDGTTVADKKGNIIFRASGEPFKDNSSEAIFCEPLMSLE